MKAEQNKENRATLLPRRNFLGGAAAAFGAATTFTIVPAVPLPAPVSVPPPVPVTGGGPQLLTEDLRTGTGERARYGMTIVVHYTGWLHEPTALGYRGRKFDSSRDRGQPFTFRLGEGRVIKGWEVGILGMQVGGLRRLVIPPEMAYGSRGLGKGLIPPNSTLVFDVELLGVESSTLIENSK